MGRQIRFFLSNPMRTAIESEARRLRARLVTVYRNDHSAIQFSESAGTDHRQGRLWTQASDVTHYDALCRAVKKDAFFDRDSGLWVKRHSRAAFDVYRDEQKKALSELVERNRKNAIEVLAGRVAKNEG